jgi:hypothetical protein
MATDGPTIAGPIEGNGDWRTDLDRVAARDHWGRALMVVGWIHLATFLVCQVMHVAGDRVGVHFLLVWAVELAAVLVAIRAVAGRGWTRSTPLIGIFMRVWATFLILSFNLAAMNTLSGVDYFWFKPALASLSTFGLATMAYLTTPLFFIPAVQMYVTGLLMVWAPDDAYLIYGLSWWLALQGIGLVLERRRRLAGRQIP